MAWATPANPARARATVTRDVDGDMATSILGPEGRRRVGRVGRVGRDRPVGAMSQALKLGSMAQATKGHLKSGCLDRGIVDSMW